MEPEKIASRVQSVVGSVDPKEADLARLRTRLNKFMTCLWHIEWWGEFRDLCWSTDFCANTESVETP